MDNRSKSTRRSQLTSTCLEARNVNDTQLYTSLSRWLLGALVTLTPLFLLIALAGGLILVAPASGQSTESPNTKTGSILGTVVDTNNETIPNATVILQNPVGDPLTVVTNDDGSFAFHDV